MSQISEDSRNQENDQITHCLYFDREDNYIPLQKQLSNKISLQDRELYKTLLHLWSAIAWIHQKYVAHRNIKLQTIHINQKTQQCKLSEFKTGLDLSKPMNESNQKDRAVINDVLGFISVYNKLRQKADWKQDYERLISIDEAKKACQGERDDIDIIKSWFYKIGDDLWNKNDQIDKLNLEQKLKDRKRRQLKLQTQKEKQKQAFENNVKKMRFIFRFFINNDKILTELKSKKLFHLTMMWCQKVVLREMRKTRIANQLKYNESIRLIQHQLQQFHPQQTNNRFRLKSLLLGFPFYFQKEINLPESFQNKNNLFQRILSGFKQFTERVYSFRQTNSHIDVILQGISLMNILFDTVRSLTKEEESKLKNVEMKWVREQYQWPWQEKKRQREEIVRMCGDIKGEIERIQMEQW